jgi:hypothetical protein
MTETTEKTGVFQVGKRFEAYVNNELVATAYNLRSAEIALEKRLGTFVDGRSKKSTNSYKAEFAGVPNKFHINERFDFLHKAVEMVADCVQPSAIISGSGGLGKTYTVRKALKSKGMTDLSLITAPEGSTVNRDGSYVFIKGFSTPKSMYRSLFDNNGSVIVFDDCDSVLNNPVALNILKAALDSYDRRIISWNSEKMRDDDELPSSFEFTGQIIFITNLDAEEVDQAIRSRSLMIDVSMTLQETVDRMSEIIKSSEFLPEYSMQIKQNALEFIDENKLEAKELSLRTLITVCKIRSEFPNNWKNMCEYVVCN